MQAKLRVNAGRIEKRSEGCWILGIGYWIIDIGILPILVFAVHEFKLSGAGETGCF
jgi:hypothetical protein